MRFIAYVFFCFFWPLCIFANRAAADSVHYVRATVPITLRDGIVIPPGVEILIQYDAGDSWISYGAFRIPKTSAILVDIVIFNPVINGVVNRLTPIYLRTTVLRSAFGSKPIPNSTGLVLEKGDTVRIIDREGEFYSVDTNNLRNALVPIESINASKASLADGKVVPVPSFPANDTNKLDAIHAPPQPGQLFGRLKVPYTLEGKPLPADSYIVIAYDGGKDWILGGRIYQNHPRISKVAVDIVNRVNFYTPLTGRISSPTTVYKFLPNTFNDPRTLEQSEIFSNLNPSVRVGDYVYITAREGADYVVQIPQSGRIAKPGRIPVSAIKITLGSLDSGTPVFVPPLPLPVMLPPQATVPTSHFDPTILAIVAGVGLCAVILIIFVLKRKSLPAPLPDWRSTYPEGFPSALRARFPNHKIYFVPEAMMSLLNISTESPVPAFYEGLYDRWNAMLKMYPRPPHNHVEQDQREEAFWKRQARLFTITNSPSQSALRAKQDIVDYFQTYEKWIFRDFYAATGIVHKTIIEDSVRHILELEAAHQMKTWGDPTSLSNNQKRNAIEKAKEAERRFIGDTMTAHYMKWGGWFYSHIQDAFANTNAKRADYGPESATTSGDHSANDDLRYKPTT